MDDQEPRPLVKRGELGRWRRLRVRAEADSQASGRNNLAHTGAEPPDHRLVRWRLEVTPEDIKEFVERSSDGATRQQDVGDFMGCGEGVPARASAHVGQECKLRLVEEGVP